MSASGPSGPLVIYLSLKIVFFLSNNADPDDMPPYASS